MTSEYTKEVSANLQRAGQSIQAAKQLAVKGYHDFAASRAYYAAFYGATAVLLNEGLDFRKHSGVIASIHQRFVKTGKLSEEQGKDLNWLFEIRNVGDYGGAAHVSQPQAERAIQAVEVWNAAEGAVIGIFHVTC
jgi:uncharacterized protein (UPF0332 family)